jgi:hypothetical protein
LPESRKSVPLQELTWILEPGQIDGEPFTMGGNPVRIERLPDPQPVEQEDESAGASERKTGVEKAEPETKVISFPPRAKK